MRGKNLVYLVAVACLLGGGAAFADAPLTLEQRLQYQEKIERVYFQHRTGNKKTFEETVPRAVIEAKVQKYLRQCAIVEEHAAKGRGYELNDARLQSELERICHSTKAPDTLKELFAALDGNAYLVKEILIRPILAEKMARVLYQGDAEFQKEPREKAEKILAESVLLLGEQMEATAKANGEYAKVTLRALRDAADVSGAPQGHGGESSVPEEAEGRHEGRGDHAIEIDADVLSRRHKELRGTQNAPKMNEMEEGFVVERLVRAVGAQRAVPQEKGHSAATPLQEGISEMEIESIRVPKKPYEEWLDEATRNAKFGMRNESENIAFATPRSELPWLPLPPILLPASAPCTPDSWTILSTADAPERRYAHTAVWTGVEMIVWGGENGDYLNTGGFYNPTTDTWTATTTVGAPTKRWGHTAVWTGSEMIIWGGEDGYFSLKTGGSYNPITDTWTVTTTAGAPAVRSWHTAVWTEAEMIVWGGAGLKTGGLYNPNTDTWIDTKSTGAPFGRKNHTAVWTGTEMVVWGGLDSYGSICNTGGRYKPTTDMWTPTDMWFPRTNHTAVWTGSEMIVWGGNGGLGYINTGDRYIPATDTWIATTTTGAPTARYGHTAVWTGAEMIVWGGGNSNALNTGGRYNPATDTWTDSTTSGAPSVRKLHTAVWAETEMIVWGGFAVSSGNLNTGGIYTSECSGFTGNPSSVPDGGAGSSPFTVALNGGSLDLAWDSACNASDYAVMAGDLSTIASGYNHASLQCSTDGATTATVNPAGSTLYFLVVPHNAAVEGSYGTDSAGMERPPASSVCYAQSIGSCP